MFCAAKISGERLQDHWSSGIYIYISMVRRPSVVHPSVVHNAQTSSPVILFGHFYHLIRESFPIQKWSLFSQFDVFMHLFSQFIWKKFPNGRKR